MSQSNFPPPQDFSAESFGQPSFGQPMYQEPPRQRSGGRTVMLVCGVLVAIMLLCCCCCVGAVALAARSPAGVVGFWGVAGIAESWDFAQDNFVCEGSEAAALTQQYATSGARFTSFNATDNAATDGVEATGVLEMNGQTQSWEATFYTADGGTFGTCIDRIEVE